MTDDVLPPIAAELRQRLDALCAEGWDLWSTFDVEVRQDRWHPFIAAEPKNQPDYTGEWSEPDINKGEGLV